MATSSAVHGANIGYQGKAGACNAGALETEGGHGGTSASPTTDIQVNRSVARSRSINIAICSALRAIGSTDR